MNFLFLGIAIFIVLLAILSLYRIANGPTIFDRVIGASLIGTHGIMILTLIGFIYERIDMFVDLSIAYALLNFIGVIAVGKYLERKR